MDATALPWQRVVSTFAALRWRLFLGAVRRGGTEQVGAIVSVVVAAFVALVSGVGLVISGRTTTEPVELAVATCTLVTVAVIAFGIVAGVTQPVDPRVIAALPLDDRRRALGVLVAAAVGPAGIAGATICVALAAGMVRTASGAPVVLLGAVIWGATLLVVARTATNLLALLLARSPRIGQVVVGLSGLGLGGGVHLVPVLVAGLDEPSRARLLDIAAWTPPGALGVAIAAPSPAATIRITIGVAWLVLLAGAFLVSERRLATSVRRESAASARTSRTSVTMLERRFVDGPSGAVARRGLLLRFRHPRTALETVTGAAIGLAAALAPAILRDEPGAGSVLVGGAVQLSVLFMAGNCFGTDGPGTAHDFLTGCSTADLVDGKRRSVLVVAAPVAVLGPLLASAITGAWGHLPAGWCVALGGLLAGTGAAMVQSVTVPIAVPESDNPFAGGDSGSALAAALLLASVLMALAVITLPVALALFWATDRGRTGLVTGFAVLTIGVGWAAGRIGRRIALRHLARREPEFLAALVPVR
ncbi:MAG: hypothetical protein ACO307_00135 [Ilumatobacteraceae bacterium]